MTPRYTDEEYEVGSWVLYRDDTPIAWFEAETDAVLAAELFNEHEKRTVTEPVLPCETDEPPVANRTQTARELHILDENPPSELP